MIMLFVCLCVCLSFCFVLFDFSWILKLEAKKQSTMNRIIRVSLMKKIHLFGVQGAGVEVKLGSLLVDDSRTY